MLTDSKFWAGVVVGVVGIYAYHRVKGLPPKKA